MSLAGIIFIPGMCLSPAPLPSSLPGHELTYSFGFLRQDSARSSGQPRFGSWLCVCFRNDRPSLLKGLCRSRANIWERMRQSGSRLTRPAYSRVMREVVAKRIMEMAQRGVEDREALVEDALRFITANYEQPSKLAK